MKHPKNNPDSRVDMILGWICVSTSILSDDGWISGFFLILSAMFFLFYLLLVDWVDDDSEDKEGT